MTQLIIRAALGIAASLVLAGWFIGMFFFMSWFDSATGTEGLGHLIYVGTSLACILSVVWVLDRLDLV